MKILYDSYNKMGSVIERESGVSEEKIQEIFSKALVWAKHNIKALP